LLRGRDLGEKAHMLIVYSKFKTNRITKIPWYEFGDGLAIDISWWLVPGTFPLD
jgi:hypothetical protein